MGSNLGEFISKCGRWPVSPVGVSPILASNGFNFESLKWGCTIMQKNDICYYSEY